MNSIIKSVISGSPEGRVSSSCFTSGYRRIILVINAVISRE